MAVITGDTVRELAGFRGEGVPVTTCYLDVDGRRYHRHLDYEYELQRLLRDARRQANGSRSVHRDMQRIAEFVKGGFDRSRTRGLAFFSCADHGLWRVVELPRPVRNQLVINNVAAVGQLESVVEESERYGVLLVDKQRARMFVFQVDELVEQSERFDELPRDYDVRGERDLGDVSNHVDALAGQHLKRAAAVAFEVFRERGFDHLCIGAPDELYRPAQAALHPYLRERMCGPIPVVPSATIGDIRRAVIEVEARQERSKEAAMVERLRQAVGSGRRGVAGLDAVLSTLYEHRVEVLLVSDDYREEGWRCPSSGRLAVIGPSSPTTGDRMDNIDNVVEEAVEEALNQGARVEVCVRNADLDVLGRIGALLRY